VIRLDKEVRRKGKVLFEETRYFMSSLDPDEVSAEQFQELILRHWEVEKCVHLQKDSDFGEDKPVVRSGWGEAWTVLTNIAVSWTQLLHRGERTLREVRKKCADNPKKAAKRLGLKI
jgi:hypothetical protein